MIIGSTFGQAGHREYNAVRSWQLAFPYATIVLFGEGTKPLASKLKVWTRGVECCPDGAPYLNEMIRHMANWSSPGEAQLWINADIILFGSARKHFSYFEKTNTPFLLTGRRWNVDIDDIVVDEVLASEKWGKAETRNGQIMSPCAADWFCFSRGQYLDMPAFAIGRTTFDQWMIYHAQKKEWLAYDMTKHVLALHQNHPESEASRVGEQARLNQALGTASYPEWTLGWSGWVSHLRAPSYKPDPHTLYEPILDKGRDNVTKTCQ